MQAVFQTDAQPDSYMGQNPADFLARGFLPDFYQAAAEEIT